MNKKILYKLLLIFALLAFTLLISNTKSFAADSTTETLDVVLWDDYNATFTNTEKLSYKNILILSSQDISGNYHLIFCCSNDGAFSLSNYDENVGICSISCVDEDNNPIAFYRSYQWGSSKGSCFNTINTNNLRLLEDGILSFDSEANNPCFKKDSVSYSSYNLLTFDESTQTTSSNVLVSSTTGNGSFFYQPPVEEETPVEEKQETTLAPIVEEVEMKKTLVEIVAILPVVLVVIVGLLAMRKAIAFLMMTLKQG